MPHGSKIAMQACREAAAFSIYVGNRFWRDRGFTKSASLSYDLLFALVPTIALAFAILTAFPILEQARIDLQSYLIHSFLPEQSEEVRGLFEQFQTNTRALTMFGLFGLLFTALLLFDTVDSVFNDIWRQTAVRPFFARVSMFWAIMTIVPLLIGGGIVLSTLAARRAVAWGIDVPWLTAALVWIAPVAVLTLAFTVTYIGLPYRRIRLVHALIGGAVAALLLQGLRWTFTLFIDASSSYWKLYGILASIPIALLWVFLFWCIVLLGAEVVACLPEWRRERGGGAANAPLPVRRLTAALLMIEQLLRGRATGESTGTQLLTEVAAVALSERDIRVAQDILVQLESARIIVAIGHAWQLARDPAQVTIAHLAEALDLGYGAGADLGSPGSPWRKQLATIFFRTHALEQSSLSTSIESLFDAEARSGDNESCAPAR